MVDPRFLPIEKREPVEDYDDEFLESDDELDDATIDGKAKGIKKLNLYIAS